MLIFDMLCLIVYLLHFIVILFKVGNVLLRVIYQLNFTVFMYVTRVSRYI
jgi:membrane protein implicated in regulation of membrane protease activity